MPNRIIRESARTSGTLYRLSHGAERMFWRLTTVADDYGRFEADPRILRAGCFPLWDDKLKVTEIGKWYTEMETVELVKTYAVNGKLFGFFTTWDKYQQRRAKHPKYPAPTDDNICTHLLADASTCKQLLAIVPEESRSRGIEEARKRGSEESAIVGSANNGHPPPAALNGFKIPNSVSTALDQAPRLGAVSKLRQAPWWQAELRANPGVDLAREVFKAEAYLVAHPEKHYKNLGAFFHGWLGRADRD